MLKNKHDYQLIAKSSILEAKLSNIIEDIENRLKSALETKVSFRPMTKSRGRIIIEYTGSKEQLIAKIAEYL